MKIEEELIKKFKEIASKNWIKGVIKPPIVLV